MLKVAQRAGTTIVTDRPELFAPHAQLLASRDVRLTVSGKAFHLAPGDSVDDLKAEVERRQNAAHVAIYRGRKSGKLPPVKRKSKKRLMPKIEGDDR